MNDFEIKFRYTCFVIRQHLRHKLFKFNNVIYFQVVQESFLFPCLASYTPPARLNDLCTKSDDCFPVEDAYFAVPAAKWGVPPARKAMDATQTTGAFNVSQLYLFPSRSPSRQSTSR